MKQCTKCKILKKENEFYKDKTKQDGLTSACKHCKTTQNENWRKNNLEQDNKNKKRYREENKDKLTQYHKEHHKNNKDTHMNNKLKLIYGIDLEIYKNMLVAQNNCCAICKKAEQAIDKRTNSARALSVDHDHKTGKIRALLCNKCNTALGLLNEDLLIIESMVAYLKAMQ